jgi:capsular exopolysaccharide synthesis family protein
VQEQRLTTLLWRGKWLIVACLAVGIVLAILATKQATKVYQGTAILNVTPAPTSATAQTLQATQIAGTQALAATYATLIVDPSFLGSIASHLPPVRGKRLSPSELQSNLAAKAITNTTLVQLQADAGSPRDAQRLAGAVAGLFVDNVRTTSGEENRSLQAAIETQIADLNTKIAAARASGNRDEVNALVGAQKALTQQQAQLLSNGLLNGFSVRRSGRATASATPIRPRPVLNLIVGALLGFVLGIGLAWLRQRLDRALHSSDEAEALLNVPILASIPIRDAYSSEDPVLGEAYDVLRANLAFIGLDQPLKVLTVSSFNPREGKTSTVQGLAFAAARGGMRVAMIDGDVRTRTLSKRLGFSGSSGLTTVMIGAQTLERAVVEVTAGLTFLPAGPTPPNPASLLSSNRLREIIEQLRDEYSLVIIDSPPVAHLADASFLAAASDGVAVVARVGVTARADLPSAAANLRHSPTPLIGVVVLEHREIDETYYPAVSKGARTEHPVSPS